MIVKVDTPFDQPNPAMVISLRCPSCKDRGTFDPVGVNDLRIAGSLILGQRRCPNPACLAHVFFVYRNNKVEVSYPAERIDFDATNIPTAVLASMEEAITCHASGCFVAAAMMVRKALEALCADRSAAGDDLKQRIKALGTKVVLPSELLNGVDDLRLLGNDAAHIESREFDKVGQEEVEVALEFAKEVLKAVYQYSHLLQRLRALKAQSAPSP